MACTKYTIVPQDCPCRLGLKGPDGPSGPGCPPSPPKLVPLDLQHATVMYTTCGEGYYIKTPCGNAVIDASCFELTFEELQDLVYACCDSGPSGTPNDPVNVDISGAFCPCDEVVTEGLPVKIICDDSNDNITLACTDENQLVFLDTSSFPPEVFNFDGTPYTGPIRPCENEYIQHIVDYCDGDDTYTKIVCINKTNPTDVQVLWLFEGEIVDEPENAIPCESVCSPYINEWSGSDITGIQNTEPYNSIEIYNASCCKAVITTSAGTFSVPPNRPRCIDFDCNLDPDFEVQVDDPECLEQITVTIQRKK